MSKQMLFGKEAREKLQKGVNAIADAVSVTLGASGKNVMIGDAYSHDYQIYPVPTKITKDGVTVARFVQVDDPFENRGVMLLREASEKTMQQAGDGTTTTIVLARAMVNKGIDLINEGANPMQLKKDIDEAVNKVVEKLKELAIPMKGDIEKIRQIATVSANNDDFIGNLIAEAFEKIGDDGVIDIQESNSSATYIKVEDGFKFDNGYLHELFITNRTKHEAELANPYILLYDRPLTKMAEIIPILQQIQQEQKPVLIICADMNEEALAFMTTNVMQKTIKACVVKCPMFLESRRDTMEDIAAATGAAYLTDQRGVGIENAKLNHLGSAKKVIVGKNYTIIIEGKKDKKVYNELVSNLKMDLAKAENETQKEPIEKRIARLEGGVAVIYVGATTEVEMGEKKDRVDDAVRATKSAISEGYLAGAGTSLIRCANGNTFINSILEQPLRQICINAGVEDIDEMVGGVASFDGNVGYNAISNNVEDLVESGIIDAAKVVRCALQNAASISGMILTSDCVIVKCL